MNVNSQPKQICRKWLKFTFLSIGSNCSDKNCQRKHEIVESKDGGFHKLYGDYSFKGLNKKQQSAILEILSNKNTTETVTNKEIDHQGSNNLSNTESLLD